jgi:hypothetical protein
MAAESVIVMIFSWAIAILATLAFDWGGPLEIAARVGGLLGLIVGVIALLRFLIVFLFVKEDVVEQSLPRKDLNHPAEPLSLPPPQQQPIPGWRRRSTTREIVERPSVTENTTRLLDENDRQ